MEKLTTKQIQNIAKQMIIDAPNGIRWMQMLKGIAGQSPETPPNTIHGAVHALLKKDADIIKIARGTYVYAENVQADDAAASDEDVITVQTPAGISTLKEEQFYGPFAEWLREDLEEANHVIPLGGNVFKGKWGTPDVLGVLRPQSFDLIKYQPQIVSAELKIDPAAPIVGFGQTVAYRLFSHKSYLAMPETLQPSDLQRLEALAIAYGLGLVLFSLDVENPNFTLRIRAVAGQPDVYYLNEMAERLKAHSKDKFAKLFG